MTSTTSPSLRPTLVTCWPSSPIGGSIAKWGTSSPTSPTYFTKGLHAKSSIISAKQVSYPNFVRGLLFDSMQPLIDHFKVLGTLCCTICEVRRRAENQKEALLRNPWDSVTYRKSKGSIVTQSMSFRNFLKVKKGVITWSVRSRNLTDKKQVSLRNS